MTTDHIDAEFTEPADVAPLAVRETAAVTTPAPSTADDMLQRLQEWEKFKSLAIRDKAWVKIPGIDGQYLPASEAYRIAPAVGLKWEIISLNEHGQKGVRCDIVDYLTYERKKVTKKKFNKQTKQWEEYEKEVSDTTRPIISKTCRYTVTIRASDSFRYVDVEGAFDALEMPKSDYQARQQALTRARRNATLILVGGIDKDVAEEIRAARVHARDAKSQEARPIPSNQQILSRAKEMGLCSDASTFYDWVMRTIPALADTASKRGTWKPTGEEKTMMVDALNKIQEERIASAATQTTEAEDEPKRRESLQRMMFALCKEHGVSDDSRHQAMLRRYARSSSNDLTCAQLQDFIAYIRGEVT